MWANPCTPIYVYIYIHILHYVLCICVCLILISFRSFPESHQLHTKVLSSSGVLSGSAAQDGFTERRTRMERTCDGPTKGSHRARLLQIHASSSYFEQNEFVRTPWLWSMLILIYIYIYHFFGGDHSPHEQSRQAATRFPFRLGETCWNTANCKIHENTPSKQQSTGVTHWRVFFLRHLQPWPPSYEFAQDTRDGGRWNRHSQDWTSPRVSRQDMTWHVVELDGYN